VGRILTYCDTYKDFYSIIPSVSITAISVSIAIFIYLKQQHTKERDRIKRDFKNFYFKLLKFNDLNSKMSGFAHPPPELTWDTMCKNFLEYYWEAKLRDPNKWHFAFEYLAYLQYYIYQEFITYYESYKKDFSIIQFEIWWNGFHTFSVRVEKVLCCVGKGCPKEIANIYESEFNKKHPKFKLSESNIRKKYHYLEYYNEFFPQFSAFGKQSNMIEARISEFRKNYSNGILESKMSEYCIVIFFPDINFRSDNFFLYVTNCI
jgi:hypothetical protein